MKKVYQEPALEVIGFLTEDILDNSIVEPTDKGDDPVVIGPSIDITLF